MVHTPAPPAPQVQHHRCHTRAIAIAPASVTVYGPGVTTHPGHNRSLGRVRLLWPGCGTCGAGPVGRAGPVGDPQFAPQITRNPPISPYSVVRLGFACFCSPNHASVKHARMRHTCPWFDVLPAMPCTHSHPKSGKATRWITPMPRLTRIPPPRVGAPGGSPNHTHERPKVYT